MLVSAPSGERRDGGKGARGGQDVLEMGELGFGRVPNLDRLGVVADQVFEVDCQGAAVALQPVAGGVDALGDVEDDGGEAVFVDVDFLVIGDFADRAGGVGLVGSPGEGGGEAGVSYLTSAKLSGRSHTSAPPKSGVLL